MRRLMIVTAMLLCGCATRPSGDVAMYKGVYAPRTAEIAADGKFTVRSSVWKASDRAIAVSAARSELRQRAEKAGYSLVEISEVRTASIFGEQVLITGRVFKEGNGSAKAVPLAMVDFTSEPQDAKAAPEKAKAKPRPVKAAKAAKPKSAPKKPVEAVPTDDPLVIEAPEFISVVPQPRPFG